VIRPHRWEHRAARPPHRGSRGRPAGSAPADHDAVEAGVFQLGGEEPPALGIPDGAGEGGFGVRHQTGLAGDGRAGQRAEEEGQDVAGIEGVDARRHLSQDVVEAHGAAAHIGAVERLRWGLHPQTPLAEIHVQDPPGVSVTHGALL
jgi:hypothetical protein